MKTLIGMVAAAMVLVGNTVAPEQQTQMSVERWRARVAERIDYLLAENTALREEVRRLWTANNKLVAAHCNNTRIVRTNLTRLDAWSRQVNAALNRVPQEPIIVLPPPQVTVEANTAAIETTLKEIEHNLQRLNW